MSDILFKCTINGWELIPAVRTTSRSKHTNKRAIAYGEQQVELGESFQHQALIDGVKCPIPMPVELELTARYTDGRKRDGDNIFKAVSDALVKAGIILDDNVALMPKGRFTVALKQREARLVVQLRKIKGKP